MLLRFAVSNFRSIRDEQELSLVASQAIKDDPRALIETPALRKDKALPAALIYGANASGKSNVVEALRFMCRMVLDSHTDFKPGSSLGRPPFRLAPGWAEKESRFDLTFVHEGVRYQYGFTALDDRFGSEWLYAWPSGSQRELFSREGQEFKFGRSLKGDNQLIARITRRNSLFVSSAAQHNLEQLAAIYSFFSKLYFDLHLTPRMREIDNRLRMGVIDPREMKLLYALDTGIVDYRIIENGIVDSFRPRQRIPTQPELPFMLDEKAFFQNLNRTQKQGSFQFGHAAHAATVEFLELREESTGTLRLVSLFGSIFRALDTGSIVVIDEIDASLHTRACEQIIALFQSPKTNPKGAQLIATTHDTNLLNPDTLRRDQVWFTEKDGEGATHLYPLTDIHTRKGDNIEKGYLQGRFGAVPFAGSVDDFIKMD